MRHSPLKKVKSLSSALGTAWCVVGVCIIAVFVVECGLRLTFLYKDSSSKEFRIENRVLFGPSGDALPAPLASSYWGEYKSSKLPTWQSYVYWRRPPFSGKYVNVDSLGLRRTWTDPTPSSDPEGRLRVFVFGGSTTWGSGARDDFTVPSFLAKSLRDSGIAAQVLNFGEGGYVNTQEVIALMLCVQTGDIPDAVVFYDGYNDTFSAFQNGVAGIPQNERNRRAEFNLLRDRSRLWDANVRRLPSDLKGFNRLASSVRSRLGIESAVGSSNDQTTQDHLPEAVLKMYEANMAIVRALGDSFGFSSHFFWQPIVYTKRNLTPQETRYTNRLSNDARKFFLAVYDRVQKSESLKEDQHFNNISAIFDGIEGPIYLDYAHVTEEGNSIIANSIAEILVPAYRQKVVSEHPIGRQAVATAEASDRTTETPSKQ